MKRGLGQVSALLGLVLLGACRRGPFPGDPLEAARKAPPGKGKDLLLDPRLTSAQRARVAAILAARFKEKAVPWIGAALRSYPLRAWPDRFLAARALRATGKASSARRLLLQCLEDREDPGLRREAARALAPFLPDGEVRKALLRAAREDPSPLVREAAGKTLGR